MSRFTIFLVGRTVWLGKEGFMYFPCRGFQCSWWGRAVVLGDTVWEWAVYLCWGLKCSWRGTGCAYCRCNWVGERVMYLGIYSDSGGGGGHVCWLDSIPDG
jgi:hypothetical protein